MRSMPPASSHFADRPVPAPPPMMGSRRRTLGAQLFQDLVTRDAGHAACPFLGSISRKLAARAARERGVVEMQRQADQLPVRCRNEVLRNRIEQRPIRCGIPERAIGLVQSGDAALGNQEPHRALHPIELGRDEATDLRALLGRGAHQRHVGVMAVQTPAAKRRRHRVHGPEVHHVECAAGADIGHPRARDGIHALRTRRQHATDDLVRDLGGGDVDHRREELRLHQLFHRLAAGPGGVEHDAVVVRLQAAASAPARRASSGRTW